jgi:exopolysaccharide biosynthesis polyprenyl glycosylphosphotransferase
VITASTLLFLVAVVACMVIHRPAVPTRLLIVGTGPLAAPIADAIAARRDNRYALAGIVTEDGIAGLAGVLEDQQPDRIVLALADRRGRVPMTTLLQARVAGVVVEEAVECYERLTGKIAIEALKPSWLIASRDFRKTHGDLAFGHALSLVVSAAAVVALAPVFAVLAIAIVIDSPGPVFFVHERAGLRGRPLRLLKFRTMRAAEGPTSEWVRDNHHRVTRLGKWLRRFRLDELPQLINVLRGEMNLVGPRPHPVSNVALFNAEIPYYALRSTVRPGLTGWAQVYQGYANSLDEETEKMRYDLYYIKHMSAWLDLRILCLTVWIVLSGRGSSAVAKEVGKCRTQSLVPGV